MAAGRDGGRRVGAARRVKDGAAARGGCSSHRCGAQWAGGRQPVGRAAWEALLLEAQPEVGGAVRSDRELHPDFVSDTFSAFYPMAASSRVITRLHLEDSGCGGAMPLRCLGIHWPTGAGSCCTVTSMAPRSCWTRSILETATLGAPFMISGGQGRFPPRPCDRQGRLRTQRSSAVERAAPVRSRNGSCQRLL